MSSRKFHKSCTNTNGPLLLSFLISGDVSLETNKIRKWTPREWEFLRTHSDLARAKTVLAEEKVYGPAYNDKSKITRFYRCKHTSQRSKEKCVSMAKLVLSRMSDEVHEFRTSISHNHDDVVVEKKRGLSQEMQETLNELFDKGMNTSQIKSYLLKKGIDGPSSKQITYYKSRYRKKVNGPALTTLALFEEWCICHATQPDTEDGAFVYKYEVVYPADGAPGKHCRAFLTTKKLICNAANAYILHADGTHKLTTTGFPGLVLGTTDANARFNLIAICVCPGETVDDYKFVFQSLKEAAESFGIRLNIS